MDRKLAGFPEISCSHNPEVLTAEQLKLSNEQGTVTIAQAAARNAMSTALAQVKAQYKSKLDSVAALRGSASMV